MIGRRGFITGLTGLIAAPTVIRTPGLLMPIRSGRGIYDFVVVCDSTNNTPDIDVPDDVFNHQFTLDQVQVNASVRRLEAVYIWERRDGIWLSQS
jgi:hypothetical protein